jgi:DNA repair protein RadD
MAEGKKDCIVLDYGSNALRHGPIDCMEVNEKTGKVGGEAPCKKCPECREVVHAAVARCPACAYEFPRPEVKHDNRARGGELLSGDVTMQEHRVVSVSYHLHEKKGDPTAPKTMRVEYQITEFPKTYRKEWICFSHQGRARMNAESWWRARSNEPVPGSSEEAVALANDGVIAVTNAIRWQEGGGEKYGRIVDWDIGPKPEFAAGSMRDLLALSDDEIPF